MLKFYLAVHQFRARAQSSTCTTYGKYLRESIMAEIGYYSYGYFHVKISPKLLVKPLLHSVFLLMT